MPRRSALPTRASNGALGDAACLSFYPKRIWALTATRHGRFEFPRNSPSAFERCATHGQTAKYFSSEPGWKQPLDEIQAVFSSLASFRNWRAPPATPPSTRPIESNSRRDAAHRSEGFEHVFHQSPIRIETPATRCKQISGVNEKSDCPSIIRIHCICSRSYASVGHKPGDFRIPSRRARKCFRCHVSGIAQENRGAFVEAHRDFLKCKFFRAVRIISQVRRARAEKRKVRSMNAVWSDFAARG